MMDQMALKSVEFIESRVHNAPTDIIPPIPKIQHQPTYPQSVVLINIALLILMGLLLYINLEDYL